MNDIIIHPNEPKTIEQLFYFEKEALLSGDERKVYTIGKQIERRKKYLLISSPFDSIGIVTKAMAYNL